MKPYSLLTIFDHSVSVVWVSPTFTYWDKMHVSIRNPVFNTECEFIYCGLKKKKKTAKLLLLSPLFPSGWQRPRKRRQTLSVTCCSGKVLWKIWYMSFRPEDGSLWRWNLWAGMWNRVTLRWTSVKPFQTGWDRRRLVVRILSSKQTRFSESL